MGVWQKTFGNPGLDKLCLNSIRNSTLFFPYKCIFEPPKKKGKDNMNIFKHIKIKTVYFPT